MLRKKLQYCMSHFFILSLAPARRAGPNTYFAHITTSEQSAQHANEIQINQLMKLLQSIYVRIPGAVVAFRWLSENRPKKRTGNVCL